MEAAIRRFDELNGQDPNVEQVDDVSHPRELLYAKRLTEWVSRLCPGASIELQLAARCQHLCRWMIPRQSHAEGRTGYLQWRNKLKRFHADKAGEILRELGFDEAVIRRVQELNLKKPFPEDPESRVLEDALCLVFLQYQFTEFAARKKDELLVGILRKTWQKMTDAARREALRLPCGKREAALLRQALDGFPDGSRN